MLTQVVLCVTPPPLSSVPAPSLAHLLAHDNRADWFVMTVVSVPKGQHDLHIWPLFWTGLFSFRVYLASLAETRCGMQSRWRLAERPSGSTVSGATAVFGLVNHSRRIKLRWLHCSTRSLEVRNTPSYGFGWERKWVRKQRETKHEMWGSLGSYRLQQGVLVWAVV